MVAFVLTRSYVRTEHSIRGTGAPYNPYAICIIVAAQVTHSSEMQMWASFGSLSPCQNWSLLAHVNPEVTPRPVRSRHFLSWTRLTVNGWRELLKADLPSSICEVAQVALTYDTTELDGRRGSQSMCDWRQRPVYSMLDLQH